MHFLNEAFLKIGFPPANIETVIRAQFEGVVNDMREKNLLETAIVGRFTRSFRY